MNRCQPAAIQGGTRPAIPAARPGAPGRAADTARASEAEEAVMRRRRQQHRQMRGGRRARGLASTPPRSTSRRHGQKTGDKNGHFICKNPRCSKQMTGLRPFGRKLRIRIRILNRPRTRSPARSVPKSHPPNPDPPIRPRPTPKGGGPRPELTRHQTWASSATIPPWPRVARARVT